MVILLGEGRPMEGVAGTASRTRSLSDWIWRDAAQAAQIKSRASDPYDARRALDQPIG